MYTSRMKIQKGNDEEPTKFEESVAQALFDLENTNEDLKSDLKDLYINRATKVNVSANCKAVVILYPYKLREGFRKIHLQLVKELEKKFTGNVVLLIARRKFVPAPKRNLAASYDVMMRDIVRPGVIAGTCVGYRNDGSMFNKYLLHSFARNETEHKLEAFAGVFKKLCGKDVEFEYPVTEA